MCMSTLSSGGSGGGGSRGSFKPPFLPGISSEDSETKSSPLSSQVLKDSYLWIIFKQIQIVLTRLEHVLQMSVV